MSDDEVGRLASELLHETAGGIKFPQHVRVQDSGDVLTFILSLENAEITYKPQRDAERIIRRREEDFLKSADRTPPGLWQGLMRRGAAHSIKLLLTSFHLEFGDLLSDLPAVAEVQAEWVDILGADTLTLPLRVADDIEKLRRSYNRRLLEGRQIRNREHRFHKLIDERRELIKPALLLLSVFYDDLLCPLWKDVKKRYRRYRASDQWHQHIALDFAEFNLPPDLVERLNAERPNGNSYESQPSAIALEHSARRCGLPPNHFGARQLMALLGESRAWRATCEPGEFVSQVLLLDFLKYARDMDVGDIGDRLGFADLLAELEAEPHPSEASQENSA